MSKHRSAPRRSTSLLPTITTALLCGVGAAAVIWRTRCLARQQRRAAAGRGKRIVILGGGFAGRNVATEFARQLSGTGTDAPAEIILVDENPYLLFTPMLTEAVGGMVDTRHIVSPVRELPPGVTFRRGRVEEIDLSARRVTLQDANHDGDNTNAGRTTLEADHLVLALGSVANYHGVPGLEEHSVATKRLADAEAVYARVLDLLARAEAEPNRGARRALLTVAVGGAGYTGVETMAAVNELLRTEVERRHQRGASLDPDDVTTVLVDPEKRLMPELKSARLAAYAERKLREAGVEVRLQTKITGAGPGYVQLDGNRRLPVGLLIWSGGEMPSPLVSKLEGVRLSKQKALEVEATGAVPGHPGVWAIGDCAALPKPNGKGTYAPTAQNATREGTLVAANIAATLCGEPTRPFTYTPIGTLALVGRHTGIAEIYGLPISGFLAWAMWRAVYLAKMPGLDQRVCILRDWWQDGLAGGRPLATRTTNADVRKAAATGDPVTSTPGEPLAVN